MIKETLTISGAEADAWPSKTTKIPHGGYAEFSEWELVENSLEMLWDERCEHVTTLVTVLRERYDESTWESVHAVVPRIIRARNEGGSNVTTVCADCVAEVVRRLA